MSPAQRPNKEPSSSIGLDKIERYLKNAIILLVLASSFAAIVLGSHLYNQLSLPSEVSLKYLSLAITSQIISLFLLSLCWMKLISFSGNLMPSFKVSAIQFGISSIGKYIPGKIFGHIGRYYAARIGSASKSTIIISTFIEQTATIHSGLVITALALAINLGAIKSIAIALTLIGASYLITLALPAIIKMCERLTNNRFKIDESAKNALLWNNYRKIFPLYFANWIVTSATLFFICLSLSPKLNISFYDVVTITSLGYFAGFAAFFSPGGLGVREATFTALLTIHVDLGTAILIATSHRLLTVFFDLLFGLWSLGALKSGGEIKK